MTSATQTVAVVGGGWAGCAAAVELAAAGDQVSLFESARTLGGRARTVEIDGRPLDNGQHILLGAYSESLRLMRLVGIDPDTALLRLPLQMCYPPGSGMEFIAPRWPAPLHMLAALLRARGLSYDDKLALARFSTTARWMDWRLNQDCTVAELLDRFDQTERLIRLMWRPLCIAALNTPPQRASAQVFLNVLRDSLGARRAASDMLIPRVDLTAIFPARAAALIERLGGRIMTACTIARIEADDAGWRLACQAAGTDTAFRFDKLVIATQPGHAAELLGTLDAAPAMPVFDYEPITTCYLQYDGARKLKRPLLALADDPDQGAWGQFVFDRGQLVAEHAGLLAVVVSASTDAIEQGHAQLANAIARQLAQALGDPALAQPGWSKVISEKRATFSCTPGLARPSVTTRWGNLCLAGDYVAGDYPATLEGAVRSGIAAAKALKR